MSLRQNQSRLFYHWLTQEALHYANQDEITLQSNYEDDQSYAQFIKSGLAKRLLKEVDQKYFDVLRANFQTKKTQQDQVKMYWKRLDGYLMQKYRKKIRREYLREQLDMDRQLTSRHHMRGREQSKLEKSIEELLRVVFYLLVQKHNPSQQQEGQSQSPQSRQSLEKRQSIQALQDKVQSSLDQTFNSTILQQSSCSIAATQPLAQSSATFALSTQPLLPPTSSSTHLPQPQQPSLHIIRQQQNQQQQQYETQANGFLSRICQLSKQVQQNLMMVVEGIEQKQVMVDVEGSEQYDEDNSWDFDYCRYQQLSNSNSNDQQNFRRIMYKRIQSIVQQNQLIQTKIQTILQQNNSLQQQLQITYNQQTYLTNKITQYQQQKHQLYHYLNLQHNINISTLQQFIDVIKHYDQENQLLQNTITQIEERNYQLERDNANRIHEIRKNAGEISKISQDINKFRTKIKLLKDDIDYLDQWVNCNQFNAQMVQSVDLGAGDQSQQRFTGEEGKQFDFQVNGNQYLKVRTSFDHALRQNNDILNIGGQKNTRLSLKLPQCKPLPCHTRMLTQSPSTSLRYSLQPKPSLMPPSNQQNINPLTQYQQLTYHPSKSLSHISFTEQQQSDEILNQKEKYRQELVKNLEGLYKEIADLTQEVTKVKEDNRLYEGKWQSNSRKINKLKSIHQAFLKQAFLKN